MKSKIMLLLLTLLMIFFAIKPSTAQMSANPPEVGAKIREMGYEQGPQVMWAMVMLYQPLWIHSLENGVKLTKDEKYGPHERHRLDVYEPENKPKNPMPILLFVYGGGFVTGDKMAGANICTYFARHGVLAISMNYRLAPEVQWPGGAEDIASVLTWIRKNGGTRNADINRIFLFGHSAGAAHVSTYIFFEQLQLENNDGVAGAILQSGPTYDTNHLDTNNRNIIAYYGKDKTKYPSMCDIEHIDGRKVPVFIVVSELDPPFVHFQNVTLINKLYERDKIMPFTKTLIGHNHFSGVMHINTKDESLGPDILEFIGACPAMVK